MNHSESSGHGNAKVNVGILGSVNERLFPASALDFRKLFMLPEGA